MTTITSPTDPTTSRSPRSVVTALRLSVLELRLMFREPAVAAGLVGFPLVTMLVIAGVFGQTPDPEFGGLRPDEHYIVGYMAIALTQLGLVSIPTHIASERELGVTRRYRAAGVSVRSILAANTLVGCCLGIGGMVIVGTTGAATYGLPAPQDPVRVLAWSGIGLACFVAVGLALGAVLPTGRAASAIGNLVFIPAFLLGGGGPPRDVMGSFMRSLNTVLPVSHVVGGLRDAWLGATDDPHQWWYPMLVAAAMSLLALWIGHRRQTPG